VTELLAGRYRIDGLLGRGGMSEVHYRYDERLDRRVALLCRGVHPRGGRSRRRGAGLPAVLPAGRPQAARLKRSQWRFLVSRTVQRLSSTAGLIILLIVRRAI
jgi:hypothetical protein